MLTNDFSSIALLANALSKHNIRHASFLLDGKPYTRLTNSKGGVWLTENDHIAYPFTTAGMHKISKDKYLAHQLADRLKVSSPKTWRITKFPKKGENQAMLACSPLVVKPSDSSLSQGVTLKITTPKQLKRAVKAALKFSNTALVQTQHEGEEIRFVVINGQVAAAILRQTPQVIGDGMSSVRDLIKADNKERAKLKMSYLDYPRLDASIIDKRHLKDKTIPAKDEVIKLGRGTMIKSGASVFNVIDEVHDTYKKVASDLANEMGAKFIVVDMIIEDYKQKLTETNYVFLEFNTAPVLRLFYGCRDGRHYDIVKDLVPMILTAMGGK